MKKGIEDRGFISGEAGELIGVNLGWNFYTEHECGIRPIEEAFGLLTEKKLGYEARRNTRTPRNFQYFKRETAAIIYTSATSERMLETILMELKPAEGGLAAAWDKSGFVINALPEYRDAVRNLYDAFTNKNGVILLGGGGSIFGHRGLLLIDYSKIPEKNRKEARDIDRKARNEQALYRRLEKESGVFELLKKVGKEFYSLSIRHVDENGIPRWWLNPCMQHTYKAGWYTTKQLIQWTRNEGPVIKR